MELRTTTPHFAVGKTMKKPATKIFCNWLSLWIGATKKTRTSTPRGATTSRCRLLNIFNRISNFLGKKSTPETAAHTPAVGNSIEVLIGSLRSLIKSKPDGWEEEALHELDLFSKRSEQPVDSGLERAAIKAGINLADCMLENIRLKRELEETKRESGWQLIETAPMETPVLIFDGRIICVAEWDWLFGETSNHIKEGKPNVKYWRCVGADGYECENDFDKPSHWMPLPKPPTNVIEGGKS